MFFYRTIKVLRQVFLAFRVPPFRLHFGAARWAQDRGRTAPELNPFTFQDEPTAQNRSRNIYDFIHPLHQCFLVKHGHARELLLGDFPEPSPAQQDRHPPKSARSLRKEFSAGILPFSCVPEPLPTFGTAGPHPFHPGTRQSRRSGPSAPAGSPRAGPDGAPAPGRPHRAAPAPPHPALPPQEAAAG